MKVTKIYYKKLSNLGNYENEEIGIELEAEGKETALELLNKARLFVRVHGILQAREIEKAHKVLSSKESRCWSEVQNAMNTLEGFDHDKGELPF